MFSMGASFDLEALDLIDQRVISSPRLMGRAMKRQQPRVRKRVVKILAVEPGGVFYPIAWTTAKQRRAFFASNGFGRGIPTQRTHDIKNSWQVEFNFTEDGGDYLIENTSDHARWVIGFDQQQFHANTGWIYAPAAIDEVTPIVLDIYAQTWLVVSDPYIKV